MKFYSVKQQQCKRDKIQVVIFLRFNTPSSNVYIYLPLPIGLLPDVSESSKLPLQRESMTSKVFPTTVESIKLR